MFSEQNRRIHYSLQLILLSILPLFVGLLIVYLTVSSFISADTKHIVSAVRSKLENEISEALRGRIETAYSIVQYCYANNISQEECKRMVSTMHFDETNYIWIHVFNPRNIRSAELLVHPVPSLVGKDLSGMIDLDNVEKLYYKEQIYEKSDPAVQHIQPTELFKEVNTACARDGYGIVKYYWPKIIDGNVENIGYLKMSYVKYFEPWSWVLGAGAYADHIDSLVTSEESEIEKRSQKYFISFFFLFIGIGTVVGFIAYVISRSTAFKIQKYQNELLIFQKDLQESEARFREITFDSGDFIWEVDEKGIFTYVAGNTLRLFGYHADEIVGQSMFRFMPPDEVAAFKKIFDRAVKEKAPLRAIENTFCAKDQRLVFLLKNGNPKIDENDVLIGFRGLDHDITEKKSEIENKSRLEKELYQAHKLEAIGTLAAGIAHEINTPIQFVGDNIRFMAESVKDVFSSLKEYRAIVQKCSAHDSSLFTTIKMLDAAVDFAFLEKEIPQAIDQSLEGVERIATIVRAMKDFSHMGSETMQKEDLNQAILSTVTISRNEWKYVAELVTDLQNDLPHVMCLVGDIKQVILNLIVNAAHTIKDALHARGGEKGLITIRTYAKGAQAIIEVSDTGMGIPDEIREKVFEHFFTTKEVGKGTGQGLAITYQAITEQHGGTVTFKTKVGEGTTFVLSLPFEGKETNVVQ
jgi:PAS domain S-box-containing protein